jgi:hypothetical protein
MRQKRRRGRRTGNRKIRIFQRKKETKIFQERFLTFPGLSMSFYSKLRCLSWTCGVLFTLALLIRLLMVLAPISDHQDQRTIAPKGYFCLESTLDHLEEYYLHFSVDHNNNCALYWLSSPKKWDLIVDTNTFSGWLQWDPTQKLCFYNSYLVTEITVSFKLQNKPQVQVLDFELLLDLIIACLFLVLLVCACIFGCLECRKTCTSEKKSPRVFVVPKSRTQEKVKKPSSDQEINIEMVVIDSV